MINYVNLTNGVQAIKDYRLTDYRFIRIQSTLCEQKKWDKIISNLSDDLLLNLALGHKCVIYDYGANKQTPRAIWQGVEWIKFAISKCWFNRDYKPLGRMCSGGPYFQDVYRKLSSSSKSKLRYFKKYLNTNLINLDVKTYTTDKDNNIDYYRSLLLNLINNIKKDTPVRSPSSSPIYSREKVPLGRVDKKSKMGKILWKKQSIKS